MMGPVSGVSKDDGEPEGGGAGYSFVSRAGLRITSGDSLRELGELVESEVSMPPLLLPLLFTGAEVLISERLKPE